MRPHHVFALLFIASPALAAEPLGLPKLVELVHSDKLIASLDRQETKLLPRVLDAAADPDAIRKGQVAWMARMADCPDRDCVAREYRRRLAELPRYKRAPWKTYRDDALGVSFRYLGNRRVGACPASMEKACVAIFAEGAGEDDYEIAFEVFEKPMKTKRASLACARDYGAHFAAYFCFYAVIGNGARSAVVQTRGALDMPTRRSFRTFRFLR